MFLHPNYQLAILSVLFRVHRLIEYQGAARNMLAFTLSILIALTQLPTSSWATPINSISSSSTSSLSPRGNAPVCQNGNKAGTPQPARSLYNQIWCAPSSETYLSIDVFQPAPSASAAKLLLASTRYAIVQILKHGPPGTRLAPFGTGFDHVISKLPPFTMSAGAGTLSTNQEDGVVFAFVLLRAPVGQQQLRVRDANGHQVTWGVLGAAVRALAAFMESTGYGTVRFRVYDGPNQVGVGEMVP